MQEQKRRGPKRRFGPRQEVHLKFNLEVMTYIESHSPQGYQAYFDELVKRDMKSEGFQITWSDPADKEATDDQIWQVLH